MLSIAPFSAVRQPRALYFSGGGSSPFVSACGGADDRILRLRPAFMGRRSDGIGVDFCGASGALNVHVILDSDTDSDPDPDEAGSSGRWMAAEFVGAKGLSP